jgi:hypothetical protein
VMNPNKLSRSYHRVDGSWRIPFPKATKHDRFSPARHVALE